MTYILLLLIASTVPLMKDLMKYVCDKYAANWKRIGYLLDMSPGTLNAIERNFPSNVKWCCQQMFEEWLQMDATASWGKVFAAIDSPIIHDECVTEINVTQGKCIIHNCMHAQYLAEHARYI